MRENDDEEEGARYLTAENKLRDSLQRVRMYVEVLCGVKERSRRWLEQRSWEYRRRERGRERETTSTTEDPARINTHISIKTPLAPRESKLCPMVVGGGSNSRTNNKGERRHDERASEGVSDEGSEAAKRVGGNRGARHLTLDHSVTRSRSPGVP